eukprot:TRINITY_DN6066_c0_g1_i1.p1 TRINITY_DN6066_c0_g1~~TRINITY_DN6066_c0_g1_i1.p1  ORF type:complete len:180 (+),score=39.91 TRINITY_DN6066_c0_g1_i1:128-667(+)
MTPPMAPARVPVATVTFARFSCLLSGVLVAATAAELPVAVTAETGSPGDAATDPDAASSAPVATAPASTPLLTLGGEDDSRGPVVVHKDGSMGRVARWDELTEAEKNSAVRLITKRNRKRLAALQGELPRHDGSDANADDNVAGVGANVVAAEADAVDAPSVGAAITHRSDNTATGNEL